MENAVLDFLDAELDIFVHGSGDVGNRFTGGGLVVVIGVMPDDFAKLQVVKLHVEIEAGDNTTGTDFPERVEVAGQGEINAGVAAERPGKPRARCSAAICRTTSAKPCPFDPATRIVTCTGPGGSCGGWTSVN